jgi:recombination protein RecA
MGLKIEQLIKEGIVKRASDLPPLERLPSGSLSVDYVLGGGWVRGAIHFLVGSEGVGKSSLTMTAIRQLQQRDENATAIVLDLERSWFPERLKDWAIDLNRVDIARPSTLEQAYDIAFKGVEEYDVVVIDSIGAIASEAEAKASVAEKQYAPGAREANAFLRRIVSALNGSPKNPYIFILSQVRDTMNFAGHTTPVGGHGIRHYSHIWLNMRLRGYVTIEVGDAKLQVGQLIQIRSEKNKTASPFRIAELVLLLHPYKHLKPPTFDLYFEVLVWGEKFGLINHKGAWYSCVVGDKEIKWQGREGIYQQPKEVIDELVGVLREQILAQP